MERFLKSVQRRKCFCYHYLAFQSSVLISHALVLLKTPIFYHYVVRCSQLIIFLFSIFMFSRSSNYFENFSNFQNISKFHVIAGPCAHVCSASQTNALSIAIKSLNPQDKAFSGLPTRNRHLFSTSAVIEMVGITYKPTMKTYLGQGHNGL